VALERGGKRAKTLREAVGLRAALETVVTEGKRAKRGS
jgi:hypothetical protein